MRSTLRLALLSGCVLLAAIESPLSALVVREDVGAASRGGSGSRLGAAFDHVVAHSVRVEECYEPGSAALARAPQSRESDGLDGR